MASVWQQQELKLLIANCIMVNLLDIKPNWTGSIIIDIRTHMINYFVINHTF